jgi:hypothetical protein
MLKSAYNLRYTCIFVHVVEPIIKVTCMHSTHTLWLLTPPPSLLAPGMSAYQTQPGLERLTSELIVISARAFASFIHEVNAEETSSLCASPTMNAVFAEGPSRTMNEWIEYRTIHDWLAGLPMNGPKIIDPLRTEGMFAH